MDTWSTPQCCDWLATIAPDAIPVFTREQIRGEDLIGLNQSVLESLGIRPLDAMVLKTPGQHIYIMFVK